MKSSINNSKSYKILAVIGCIFFISNFVRGSVSDFQTIVQTDPDLTHQFTFDGETNEEKLEDKVSGVVLSPNHMVAEPPKILNTKIPVMITHPIQLQPKEVRAMTLQMEQVCIMRQ